MARSFKELSVCLVALLCLSIPVEVRAAACAAYHASAAQDSLFQDLQKSGYSQIVLRRLRSRLDGEINGIRNNPFNDGCTLDNVSGMIFSCTDAMFSHELRAKVDPTSKNLHSFEGKVWTEGELAVFGVFVACKASALEHFGKNLN